MTAPAPHRPRRITARVRLPRGAFPRHAPDPAAPRVLPAGPAALAAALAALARAREGAENG